MSGTMFRTRQAKSPKKSNFIKSHLDTNHGFKAYHRMDSEFLESEQQVLVDDPEKEEEKFDNQGLLVGNQAKNKVWELFKSERKFKDFDEEQDPMVDPRFAYFKQCKELNIIPRAS